MTRTTSPPDVTLFLDLRGVIRKAFLSKTVSGGPVDLWLGRPWVDTVATVGSDNVRRMVSDAVSAGVSAFAQVTQHFPSGLEIPIEYNAVRLGRPGGLIAIGKSLQAVVHLEARLVAAQRAREQDYWKLRELETRYRLLFDATNDALVLLAPDTLRITDANPAAIRALGFGQGQEFLPELSQRDQAAVHALLQRVRDQGRTPGILVHMGAHSTAWVLRASLLSVQSSSAFLLQFTALGVEPSVNDLPDAPVAEGRDGVGDPSRSGHLEIFQQSADGVIGQWLRQSGADLSALLSHLKRQDEARLSTSNQLGQHRPATKPETFAGDIPHAELAAMGTIPDPDRSVLEGSRHSQLSPSSVIDRLGAASLPSLVREATESLERQCIEVALKRTGGKRSPAAVLLGLSRQSLHTKLVRYDMAREPWTPAESED